MTNPTKVPILLRWVLAGDGSLRGEASVYCPFQARVLSLQHCTRCRHATRPTRGPSTHEARHVACVHPGRGNALRGQDSADHTRVSDLMCKETFCVRKDVHADALMAMFVEHGFSGAPVVDHRWKPLGIVSKTDLVRERYDGDLLETSPVRDDPPPLDAGFRLIDGDGPSVSEMMTPLAFTVAISTAVSQAAALMACERVHRVPVVSPKEGVVGVLSALDILDWLGKKHGFRASRDGAMPSAPRYPLRASAASGGMTPP